MLKYPDYKYTPKKMDDVNASSSAIPQRRATAAVPTKAAPMSRPSARRVSLRLPTPETSDMSNADDEDRDEDGNSDEDHNDYDYDEGLYRDIFPGIYIPSAQVRIAISWSLPQCRSCHTHI